VCHRGTPRQHEPSHKHRESRQTVLTYRTANSCNLAG
jgi:hypothetical protein